MEPNRLRKPQAIWNTNSNETAIERKPKRFARLRFEEAANAVNQRKQSETRNARRSLEAAIREACGRVSNCKEFALPKRGNRGN